MNVLITGSCGFIGFHLSKKLLDRGDIVFGIDSMNDYYDVELKENRLKNLNNYKNFLFERLNLVDKDSLAKIFKKFKPDRVVNLAAQAGVRYSIENPFAYLDSNLTGFLNVIEICIRLYINVLIYASSSSVYGGNKKIPFSINDKVDDPLAFYGATKLANEHIANAYNNLYKLKVTGLRFFTVYGPWGRPDMAMFIFINKIMNEKPVPIFNNGKMKRDFTYIDDIIQGTLSAIDKNYNKEIFNLGNNKSEQLMKVIDIIEKKLNKKAKKNFLPMQDGDVKESFADIDYSIQKLNYKPLTSIEEGIPKLIDWYKKYYK